VSFVDLDHDGDPEAFVNAVASCNAPGGQLTELLTFRGGAIVTYPPAAGFEQIALEDVDEDGVPDLLTSGPYTVVTYPLGPSYPLRGFFVAHCKANGTFSLDDEVARAALARRCAGRDVTTLPWSDDLFVGVACARAKGASPEETLRAVPGACGGACLAEVVEVAKTTSPLRLR
jgi:hypothetical protein